MAEDIRDVILAEIRARPGMTTDEIIALHPDLLHTRIKKILRTLRRQWKEVEASKTTALDGGHRRYRYYPAQKKGDERA